MKKETENWIKKAREDLATAKYNLKGAESEAAAFFSQQAAEKSLKALQIEMLGRFDKVHDLLTLAKSLKAPQRIINPCSTLTPYYILTRYPGLEEEITKRVAGKLLEESKKVIKWVESKLKR